MNVLKVMRSGRMKRRYESKYVPGDDAMWKMKDGSNVGEKKNRAIIGHPDELAKKHKENTSKNKPSEAKSESKPQEAKKEQEPRKQQDELRANPAKENVANPKKELVSRKTPEMPANPDDLAKTVGKPENKPKAAGIMDKLRSKPKDAAPKEQPKEETARKSLGELNNKSSEIDVYKQFKSIKENGTPELAKEYLDKVVSVKGQSYLRSIALDHGISTAKNPGGKGTDLATPLVIRDRIIAKAFPSTGDGEPKKQESAPAEQPKAEAKPTEAPQEQPQEKQRISAQEANEIVTDALQNGTASSWIRHAVNAAVKSGKGVDPDELESDANLALMEVAASLTPEEASDPDIFRKKAKAAISNAIIDKFRKDSTLKRGKDVKKQMGEEFDAAVKKTQAPNADKINPAKVQAFVESLDSPVLQHIAQGKMDGVPIREIAKQLDINPATAQRLWQRVVERAGDDIDKFFQQKEAEGKERYGYPVRDDVWAEILKQSKQYPFPGEFVRCVMAAMEKSQGQWEAINEGRRAYMSRDMYAKGDSPYVPGDDAQWKMKDGSNVGDKKNQGIVGSPDDMASSVGKGGKKKSSKKKSGGEERKKMIDFLKKEGFEESDFDDYTDKEVKAEWNARGGSLVKEGSGSNRAALEQEGKRIGYDDEDFAGLSDEEMEAAFGQSIRDNQERERRESAEAGGDEPAPQEKPSSKTLTPENVISSLKDLVIEKYGDSGLVPFSDLAQEFGDKDALLSQLYDLWRENRDDPNSGINIYQTGDSPEDIDVEFKQKPEIEYKPAPKGTSDAVKGIFNELSPKSPGGSVPIWKIRQKIAEKMGVNVARHDILDGELLRMWRDGEIGLEGISDLSTATSEQLSSSIPNGGNTMFSVIPPRGESDRYEKLKGGKGDDKPDSDFNPDELAKGVKVESEHTDDKEIKKEIAKDHLTEDDDYYDKLEKVEKPTHAPRHQAPKRLDGAVSRLEALVEYRDEIDEDALEDEVRGIAREFDAKDLKEIARKFGLKKGLTTKMATLEKILKKVCGD